MFRPPPRSTLFPTRRSSDLGGPGQLLRPAGAAVLCAPGRGAPASDRPGGRDRCAGGRHRARVARTRDRKSTRLNSSHTVISYAVFCLKKKKKNKDTRTTKTL